MTSPGILMPDHIISEFQLGEILGFKDNFQELKEFLNQLGVDPVKFGEEIRLYATNPVIAAIERANQTDWIAGQKKAGMEPLVPAGVEQWISKTKAAETIDVTTRTIDRYVKNGKIKRSDIKYVDKFPRFRKSAIESLMS